jgi:hypothetical protein
MDHAVSIRLARHGEQTMLESLQRRASLSNPGDRDAILANPDAIALPIAQIVEPHRGIPRDKTPVNSLCESP